MLYSIVAVLVLVLDQAVKFYTVRNIPPQAIGDACKTLIPGVIHMTNVQNYGAAFSIMENAQTVLIVVSALFIIGIIVLISMDIIHTKFGRWTAVLVMAGALGNCIDRILLGYVVDMFEFELFNFAVFNVADIFITVCGILFCLHVIIYREPEEERNAVPRPEKKKKGKPTARQELQADAGQDEEEDVPAPGRTARLLSRKKAAAPQEEDQDDVPAPPRRSPEEDVPAPDPDDPFAEWDGAAVADARPEAKAEPAPKPAPKASETPLARKARRRTAPTVADSEDEAVPDAPTPKKPAKKAAAAAKPAPQPAKPAPAPAQEPDSAGFDEYSLEDILAEFRDS